MHAASSGLVEGVEERLGGRAVELARRTRGRRQDVLAVAARLGRVAAGLGLSRLSSRRQSREETRLCKS